MPVHRLSDMTWEEVRDTDRVRAVAILPSTFAEAVAAGEEAKG